MPTLLGHHSVDAATDAPLRQHLTGGRQLINAVAEAVRYVDISRSVKGGAHGAVELSRTTVLRRWRYCKLPADQLAGPRIIPGQDADQPLDIHCHTPTIDATVTLHCRAEGCDGSVQRYLVNAVLSTIITVCQVDPGSRVDCTIRQIEMMVFS